MRDYIYLQLDYLLSKITVIVINLLLTVIVLSSLYNAQVIEGFGYIDGFRNEFGYDYLNETFIIIEFILVFISIYIGMILAGKTNQSLMLYSVYSRKSKFNYILSRLLTGIIIMFILVAFVTSTILLITYLLTPYTIMSDIFIKLILLLLIECLQYFLLTVILMGFINHILIGLLPLLIFWTLEIVTYDIPNNINDIINLLMVNMNGYNSQENNWLIYIFIFHFFSLSYIIIMQKKDC